MARKPKKTTRSKARTKSTKPTKRRAKPKASTKKRGASARGAAGRAKTSASENRSRAQRARRRAERRLPPDHVEELARRQAELSRSTRKKATRKKASRSRAVDLSARWGERATPDRQQSSRLHAEDLRQRTAGILASMPPAPANPPSSRDMEADIARVSVRD